MTAVLIDHSFFPPFFLSLSILSLATVTHSEVSLLRLKCKQSNWVKSLVFGKQFYFHKQREREWKTKKGSFYSSIFQDDIICRFVNVPPCHRRLLRHIFATANFLLVTIKWATAARHHRHSKCIHTLPFFRNLINARDRERYIHMNK